MTEIEASRPIPKEEENKRDADSTRKQNASYYQRNKEKIKERLRLRYLEDPSYKEEVQRRTKESNKRRARELRARLKIQDVQNNEPSIYRVELPDGRVVQTEMFTSGQLAARLGRLSQVVINWERKGFFPKTLYRNLLKRRLYTAFQVEKIINFYQFELRHYGDTIMRNNIRSTGFFTRVQALWRWFPYGVEEWEVQHESED